MHIRGLFGRARPPLAGACSDVGRVREENQDSYGFFTQRCAGGIEHSLYIVADGMGGHSRGAEASRSAVDIIRSRYFESCDTDPLLALEKAFEKANQHIVRLTAMSRDADLMGTTATALIIADRRVGLAHVGDSRAYVISNGRLEQLTSDHTYVNSLVQRGVVTPDEALRHPGRHLLTQALGVSEGLTVEARYLDGLRLPVSFLLCSDGLLGVPECDLVRVIGQYGPAEASRRLVQMANQSGGRDNITALVVRIER